MVLGLMASAFAFLGFAHGPPDQAPVSCKEGGRGIGKLVIERPGDLLNFAIILVNGCPDALTRHLHGGK